MRASSYWHDYDGRDRLTSETVANADTPQVAFTTGYGSRLDGLVPLPESPNEEMQ